MGSIGVRGFTVALLATTALTSPLPLDTAFAQSLPAGGSVAAGSATISQPSASSVTVTQSSQSAVANWQSFSVGQGNSVTFVQPNASSAILNRVTGSATSNIAGSITANGQVYLVNPNGIAITKSGTVNAGGGFVASTLGISDSDFMAGKRTFTGNGASAGVSNAGTISVGRGGYAALIGGTVSNAGSIDVPLGKVGLGSGERATLDFSGDGFLQVAVPTSSGGKGALIKNSGSIKADGGSVIISAATAREAARNAVNISGSVQARSIGGRSGSIVIGGGGGGSVRVTGRLIATSRHATGGRIVVTGQSIKLKGATVDASGKTGGGTINIGGNYQGQGPLQRAETVSIDKATTIKADARESGNGGNIVVWSDSLTTFAGTISARGGALSGNGGDAEVSGKAKLDYTGFTDLRASNGSFGTLLLDPYNVIISNGQQTADSNFRVTANDSVINATLLTTVLGGANVMINTGISGAQSGNITVAAPLSWSGSATLTLQAAGNIMLYSAITAAAGGLTLSAGNGGITPQGAVSVGRFTLAMGQWVQNSANLPAFAAGDFQINSNSASFQRVAGGNGTTNSPYLLTDIYGLQGVGTSATYSAANYALANDIDASGTAAWNNGAGFVPVGTSASQFTGSLNGASHTITGLTINLPSQNNVGLIGYLSSTGSLNNLGLVGGSVSGRTNVGGLVGRNDGTISRSYVTNSVSGVGDVGGLIGYNTGTVKQAYATGSVTGSVQGGVVGGLLGYNNGNVSETYATGKVSGQYPVAGFVGINDVSGTITASYFDKDTTGQPYGVSLGFGVYPTGLIGLSTAQARSQAGYTNASDPTQNFDFTNVWYQAGDMRPILRSEAAAPVNGVIPVSNLHQLQLMDANLGASYVLTRNIDATATGRNNAAANPAGIWADGGFVPVGTSSSPFTGSLDGAGHAVTGLSIFRTDRLNVGLIGYLGTGGVVSNVGVDGSVQGFENLGLLVGTNAGTVSRSYASYANITAYGPFYDATGVGGLVGMNYGLVTQSYANAALNGSTQGGGLVGINYGTVTQSYATGGVGTHGYYAGGLVGVNNGTVSQSYSTADVLSNFGAAPGFGSSTGSLVGGNYGTVTQSYAVGNVLGGDTVGGLVGDNGGSIASSYWNTQTTGPTTGVGRGSSTGVVGLTTAQMTDLANFRTNFAGFDFANAWSPPNQVGQSGQTAAYYPQLYALSHVLAVTPTSVSRVYGDVNPTLSATYAGLRTGDAVTTLANVATTATITSGVGTYGETASGAAVTAADGATYRILYVPGGTLTVTPRPITFTLDSKSRFYGDANPPLTYTVGGRGLVNGDQIRVDGLSTTATPSSNVGGYAITATAVTVSANYTITNNTPANNPLTQGLLTVLARPITVTADAQSRVYGDANPALTYTVGGRGLVGGDTLTGGLVTNATATTGVANSSTITQGTLTSASNPNYAINYLGANLTITARPITITADAQSRVYGDANPALTYVVGGRGLVGGDTLTGGLVTNATAATGVGSTSTIAQGTLTSASNPNYAINYLGANLTITARPITITADAQSRFYGDANPALTYVVGGRGLVGGDTLTGGLVTNATAATGVGSTSTITQGTLAASANYTVTYAGANLTVTARPITITADAKSRAYGDANPVLTYTVGGRGLVNGDQLTGGLVTNATAATGVGSTSTITRGTLAASANYTVTYAGANLTITPRAIAVAAFNQSRAYGDANPVLTYVVGGNGLVNGDTLTGALAVPASATSNVGSYAITQGTLAASSNYALSYVPYGNLTITPRAIAVAAFNQSRAYGDANPVLTYVVGGNGLVNGDTLTGALAVPASATSNVGNYAITQGTLAASRNYTLSYVPYGNLSVTQRPLTITANAQSRGLLMSNPALTYTVGGRGLVNGDQLSGSLATNAGLLSLPGSYAIMQGSLTASSNYAVSYVGANLTVTLFPVSPPCFIFCTAGPSAFSFF